MNKIRFSMFIAALLVALLASALGVAPALADDGAPPPQEPAGEVVPPAEEVVTETPPAEEAAPEVSLPELLDQLPEGTEVVVTNDAGEVVPLATEEAAQIIQTAKDPIWCPTGVAPRPYVGGCTGDGTSLWDLLHYDWWYGQPYTSGTIWIQSGADWSRWDSWNDAGVTAEDLVMDDNWTWTGTTNFNLTLQGGWNGVYGSTALNAADPYSYFDVTLNIVGWEGNVTINNIVIQNANTNAAGDDFALVIDAYGAVTLNNVTVSNNTNAGSGVRGGAYIDTFGNVTINNSSFDNNEGDGLVINNGGIVTTNNLTANGNGRHGVYIDNEYYGVVAKPVTMKGIQQYNGNGGSGLVVHSYGAITVSNIVAVGNGWAANPGRGFMDSYSWGDGVYLNNTWGWFLTTPVYGAVAVNGSNLFDANDANGLSILSFGAITVNNVTATQNGLDGAHLDNCGFAIIFAGAGDCGSKAAKPITVNGTNVFNNNGDDGLEILSAGGMVKVNNVTASYNGYSGMYMDNRWTNYFGVAIAGAWMVTGYGVFNDNGWDGLVGWAYGPMTLTNVAANNNGGNGAYLRVTNVFTLNGYGIFNGNGEDGLHLQTSSTATLNNVTANNNTMNGAEVISWRSGTLGANVSFRGTNTFNDNGYYYDGADWYYYDGLNIISDGVIALNNVTANYNGNDGIQLCNHTDAFGILCGGSSNSGVSAAGITLTGLNVFSNNGADGLRTETNGAITASNLTANENGYDGVSLFNAYDPLKPANVTLTGYNTFDKNWYTGLVVSSYGAISVSNLTADFNGQSNGSGTGAILDNYRSGAVITPKPVTVTGYARVNGNYWNGLYVVSLGAITAANITATNNRTGTGAYLDNQWNWTLQNNVTLTGSNLFSGNGEDGLVVYSYGAITLSNLAANWNVSDGAYIDNWGGMYARPVTLTGVNNFNYNGEDGLYIDANGAITLSRVTANFNDQNTADGWFGSGIKAYSNNMGTITLTCMVAYGNGGNGMYISGGGKLVTVRGWYAYGNAFNGGIADAYFSAPNLLTRACMLP